MRLAASRQFRFDSGPNLTSMVDVVMVILIFLMLTGTFMGSAAYLRCNLPGTCVRLGDCRIDVRVLAGDDLSVWVGGHGPFGDQEQLVQHLGEVKAALESGRRSDQIQVLIRPAPTASYQSMVSAHAAATEAGLKRIAFVTTR